LQVCTLLPCELLFGFWQPDPFFSSLPLFVSMKCSRGFPDIMFLDLVRVRAFVPFFPIGFCFIFPLRRESFSFIDALRGLLASLVFCFSGRCPAFCENLFLFRFSSRDNFGPCLTRFLYLVCLLMVCAGPEINAPRTFTYGFQSNVFTAC